MDFLKNYETLEKTCEKMGIEYPKDPEARIRLRELWSNRKKKWANYALHTEFGVECLDKWCGMCGFHSAVEIAHERAAVNE